MAYQNLLNISFTKEEALQLTGAIETIEKIVNQKGIELTPIQRQGFGRVCNRRFRWIKKAANFMKANPYLTAIPVSIEEFSDDIETEEVLMPAINSLEPVLQKLIDMHLLIGSDLYHNSLIYYRNIKAASGSNIAGANFVYQELKESIHELPGSIEKIAKQNKTGKFKKELTYTVVLQ